MFDICQLNQLHEDAMIAAERGFAALQREHDDAAFIYFQRAYELEKDAALLVVHHAQSCDDPALEPTRSVLLRSAATLALYADNYREAEKLVALALLGDPPQKIVRELYCVLSRIYDSRRHAVEPECAPVYIATLP